MSKYEVDKLNQIDISEVLEYFQVENLKVNSFRCPNDHKKPAKLTVYPSKNICKCFNCGEVKGGPIAIAKYFHRGDFKAACEDLHQAFNIPFGDNSDYKNSDFKRYIKPKPIQTKYLSFDKTKKFTSVKVAEHITSYESLDKKQKLKLVYTYMYRYSLKTNREKLLAYYKSRGISNSIHLDKLGYLSEQDIVELMKKLEKSFPIEDLVEFGIINSAEHEYFPLQWKQIKNAVLVPAFDIYTDTIEGFMLRPVDKSNKWFKGKESRLSVPSILKPLPFGTGYKVLSGDCDIYITEGHIDALSLPQELCFIATPGVQSFEKEQLGLLKGRNIKLVFDQDEAGQKAAHGYTEITFLEKSITVLNSEETEIEGMLKIFKSQAIEYTSHRVEGFRDQLLKAGVASVEIITWDKELGKDLNDLVINGNMSKVIK